ncbi:hypothetical protein A6R68_14290 [Neotoma lepida]|uniref:Small integral membrane protein 3 n=1 Tax=Neotoma lepida TaxID=56216 RepID=A0A1A6HA21_NEOLE|nr:hypothetical protein A6R68_14290 [Neotoma lepida]
MTRWANMDAISQSPVDVLLPKHILDIWAIVLIILATIVVMTSLFLCPATAVIIYRMRTHPRPKLLPETEPANSDWTKRQSLLVPIVLRAGPSDAESISTNFTKSPN